MKYTGKSFGDAARMVDQIIGDRYILRPVRLDQKIDPHPCFPNWMWQHGHRVRPDDATDRWLRHRGVGMDSYPSCLRTSPREQYRDAATGIVSTHPAMLAMVRDAKGKPVTVHRTYLTYGGEKALVAHPRKALSPYGRSPSIRLSPIAPVMGIAEGIETALAAARLFRIPTWSVLNACGIESFEPPPGCEQLFIFADNDANGRGQLAATRAVARLRGLVAVEIRIPARLKDWDDVLIGATAGDEGRRP
jgi:putative DNA primase/helicase